MRMIQGQFPRMKDRLRLEDLGERKVIIHLMINLYNFQCSTIGHNQILTVFMKTPPATREAMDKPHKLQDLADGYFHAGRKVSPVGNNAFFE